MVLWLFCLFRERERERAAKTACHLTQDKAVCVSVYLSVSILSPSVPGYIMIIYLNVKAQMLHFNCIAFTPGCMKKVQKEALKQWDHGIGEKARCQSSIK